MADKKVENFLNKLKEFSSSVRKLRHALFDSDSTESEHMIEPQLANQLSSLSGNIETIDSFDMKDNDIFLTSVKVLSHIIESIGEVKRRHLLGIGAQYAKRIAHALGDLEANSSSLYSALLELGRSKDETLMVLLYNLNTSIQERRHFIVKQIKSEVQ